MKQKNYFLILFFLTFIFTGCATHTADLTVATVHYYEPLVKNNLKPDFKKAKVVYPPQQIALLIFKEEKKLELWAWANNKWHYIKTYPITAASGNLGPKLHEGDRQVPEGIYQITAFNPRSHYHLSLHLNYPDNFDVTRAALDGRKKLGSNIFIHGDTKSIGCIAIGDHAIEELFVLVYRVGEANTKVIIAPNDLRHAPALTTIQDKPRWLPQLYAEISNELQNFS